MELRVLQYFLAVSREESISAAAEYLHVSQPTLSIQLKALEEELGEQLLIRGTKGARKVELTDAGHILRKRAEEILALVQKAENEIACENDNISGEIFIGAAETESMRFVAQAIKHLQIQHPNIHVDIFSSNRDAVMERLDKGLLDFGIVYGQINNAKYASFKIPVEDSWKVLMRRDSPLACKSRITPDDLRGKPLILSRNQEPILQWLGQSKEEINVIATCNLTYNSTILVKEGLGYNPSLNPPEESADLCVRPLYPVIKAELSVVWKRYQVFSKASEKLLEMLRSQSNLSGPPGV